LKNNIFSFILLLITLLACDSGIPKEKEKQVEKVIEKQDQLYKPLVISGVTRINIGKGEEKQESSIAYSYYQLNDKSFRYEEEINNYLSESISTDFEQKSKQKIKYDLSPDHFHALLKNFKKECEEYGEESPWNLYDSTFIDETFEQFIQVERTNYIFSGGAHGNSYSENILFSRETGEKLKLKDFISDIPKLTKIGDKYFRKVAEIEPADNLEEQGFWFTNGFQLNGNFYFDATNLVFVYNQYEIGPYSMGIIFVKIPIREIKSILKIDVKRLK